MAKIKKTLGGSISKTTKFNKNNKSFSSEFKSKSPKSRRKTLAAILPTPKKETIVAGWTVKVEDASEETVPLSTPKIVKEGKNEATKVSGSRKKRKTSKGGKPESVPKTVNEDEIEQVNEDVENLEQKFDIKFANVKKAVEGVIKFHANNPKIKNQLFQENVPLFLQINCHRIPRGNPKILRIPLPNPVITAGDEICLIVPEVKGIKNIEHEKHVEHYETLLRKHGVENINKIMTFHEFRTEHETFEQKSRLADLYDIFLVDGRICGKVVGKCGNIFYKKRKVPAPVKLHVPKLKKQIDKALSKVFCHLHLKGDSYNIQFGHNKMEVDDLVLNIFSIVETLNKEFPGGFKNVKGLHVRIERAPSIPIYVSFANPTDIETLKVNSKKPKAYVSYKDELTTLPNAEVTVRPSGRVLVTRVKHSEGEGDNVVTDADIIEANKNIEEDGNKNEKKGKKHKRKQTEVSKVPNKKRKQGEASTSENGEASAGKLVKKKKKNNVDSLPIKVKTSLNKIGKKQVATVSIPKKIKSDSSGENLKRKPKKVKVLLKKEQKNVKINKKKKNKN